ncbi:uncharacterized protein LOC110429715 isoform X2 [Sorghum bicolor]|uniref:uncharacterized protein LOC110429715 isoform X2 n=1 Tax=Sorghum bicolor TaxID=4558 RepID=UPI000B426A65|nr:uncharacterized protein LOC110429715 isoform X2 [Sorghum bicolor]|eukprot:XP_021301792.1 uncharacterized protein LOC110429715 isoform X2 [Sorghum bicolor]
MVTFWNWSDLFMFIVCSSDATTEKRHIDPESRAANAWNESLNHSQNIYIASQRKIPILIDAARKREQLDELLNFASYIVWSAKFPQAQAE